MQVADKKVFHASNLHPASSCVNGDKWGRCGVRFVKFFCTLAQAPNARLGHIHASMAATLALRICASFSDIRYIKGQRISLWKGEVRSFFIWLADLRGRL